MTLNLGERQAAPSHLALAHLGHQTPYFPVQTVQRKGRRVGLRLQRPDAPFLEQMSRILARVHQPKRVAEQIELPWERIDGRTRLMLLGLSLAANRIQVRVEGSLGRKLGQAHLVRSRLRKGRLVMDWRWDAHWPIEFPCRLLFEGHNALYKIQVDEAKSCDGLVRTTSPGSIHRLQHRRFPRVEPRVPIRLSFEHPLLPGRTISKEVEDITYDGLGFEVDLAQDLLFHQLTLSDLRIKLPKGPPMLAVGHVCHNFERRRKGRFLSGIQLGQMTGSDSRRWRRLVGDHLAPGVQRADKAALEEIWQHYTEARYFSLSGKCPDIFTNQEETFKRTWSRVNSRDGMGQLSVWNHGQHVVGSLTTSAPTRAPCWSRAWLPGGWRRKMYRAKGPFRGISTSPSSIKESWTHRCGTCLLTFASAPPSVGMKCSARSSPGKILAGPRPILFT